MDELYRDQILEHYKRPHNFGRLDEYVIRGARVDGPPARIPAA